jgi:hypothetical protein
MPSKQDPVWAVEDERGLQLALHPTEGHARHMAQTYRTDGIEGKVVPLYRAPALTAEERQAIEDAVAELTPGPIAATLRKLLERLK